MQSGDQSASTQRRLKSYRVIKAVSQSSVDLKLSSKNYFSQCQPEPISLFLNPRKKYLVLGNPAEYRRNNFSLNSKMTNRRRRRQNTSRAKPMTERAAYQYKQQTIGHANSRPKDFQKPLQRFREYERWWSKSPIRQMLSKMQKRQEERLQARFNQFSKSRCKSRIQPFVIKNMTVTGVNRRILKLD